MTDSLSHQIARILIDIGAVGLSLDAPITFKSGIRAPIYTDNRRLPFYPAQWRQVILAFEALLQAAALPCEVIAGIEAAGIPHSAALGYHMQRPSIFVRKAAKAHGTGQRIEGGEVAGKQVVLVEDLITTGGSSLSGVAALREAGARVTDCLAISSYGFAEAADNFAAAGVGLHLLTSFPVIWAEMQQRLPLSAAEIAAVNAWYTDPHAWGR